VRIRNARLRLTKRRIRGNARRTVHRQVDIRTVRQRLAPPAHRTPIVQRRRRTERADRFRMIEGVVQPQPLVEVLLRPRLARRNHVRVRAQVVIQRDIAGGVAFMLRVDRLRRARRQCGGNQQVFAFHGVLPPQAIRRKTPQRRPSRGTALTASSVTGHTARYVAARSAMLNGSGMSGFRCVTGVDCEIPRGMIKSSMLKNGADTRERLLDAAEQLYLERGYGATSVEAIVAAAGLTKGALFHHFPTKHDLALALIERYATSDRR